MLLCGRCFHCRLCFVFLLPLLLAPLMLPPGSLVAPPTQPLGSADWVPAPVNLRATRAVDTAFQAPAATCAKEAGAAHPALASGGVRPPGSISAPRCTRAVAAAQQAAHAHRTLLPAVVPHVLTANSAQLLLCDRVVIPLARAASATVGAHPLHRSLLPLASMLLLALLAYACSDCLSGGAARVSGPACRAGSKLGAAALQLRKMVLLLQPPPLHRCCCAVACYPLSLLPWTSVKAVLGVGQLPRLLFVSRQAYLEAEPRFRLVA